MYVRARALGGAALLLVLVAGCDGEEDPPDPSPPSSSTPSSATSSETVVVPSGPVEPAPPPETVEDSKAGARVFASYYWEVVNYAQLSGDTGPLRQLSIEGCVGCTGGADAIDRIYARGGHIEGGVSRVVGTELKPKPSGGWAIAQTIHVTRQRIEGAGDLDQVATAGDIEVLMGVTFQEGRWTVTSLDV